MRPSVRMREIYCTRCDRRSLVNPLHSKVCLSCGRDPTTDVPGPRAGLLRLNRAECPGCRILHPGRNIGAPYCGRCNSLRRQNESMSDNDLNDSMYSNPYSDSVYGSFDDEFYDSSFEGDLFTGEFQRLSIARSLPQRVIDSLPRHTAGHALTSKECSICLEYFSKGELTILLGCSHQYHESCATKWLQTNDSCPLCRKIVN